MLHKKACFPDPVLGIGKVHRDYHPVCFKVVLEQAIVYYSSILVIAEPVDCEICNDTISLILCEELGSQYEVDVVCFLPEISSRGAHYMKIEAKIKTSVDIPAEHGMKILFFFSSLDIAEFRVCFIDLIIFNTIVLIQVLVETVNAVIKATFTRRCEG